MPKLQLLERARRDDGPLRIPKAIAEGISAYPRQVWAHVIIPTRSTDELNTAILQRLTVDGASALRRLIPPGSEFQFKIQWAEHSAADYLAEELAHLPHPTEGQRRYLELGAQRIAANKFPRRMVMLSIPIEIPRAADPLRDQALDAGGEAEIVKQAEEDLARAAELAWAWHDRMAGSTFRARPATVEEIAWSLRHDLVRTAPWLPTGSFATGGEMARLVNGGHATPHEDHMELQTDEGTRYLRCLIPSRHGFPATEMELPGDPWLRELTLTEDRASVPVDVSIRGRNLTRRQALKIMGDALKLTKEQERSAGEGIAQEAGEHVTEARAILTQRMNEVRKGLVGMVADNVTWIVEAPSLAKLNKRCDALIDQYGDAGITLWQPKRLQHILYKETVLGDRMRYRDCEQLRPWTTLVGGWFHGGSQVGRAAGPFLASNIGTTPGPYRDRLTDAQLQNKPITTAFVGRSRAGKSTGVMLAVVAEVIMGAWGILVDRKGDLAGIVKVARSFGVHVTELNTSNAASGSMDFFRYIDEPEAAASHATDYLLGLLPLSAADKAEAHVRAAAMIVSAYPQEERSTHGAIEVLCRAMITVEDESGAKKRVPNVEAQAIGVQLRDLAADPLARPVAGPWDQTAPGLPTGPGLVYLRLEDVRMPGRNTPQANWKPGQRLSVGLVQAAMAYATYTASKIKGLPKIVALTELHLLTPYDFGRDFIGWLARMGAALDVNLLLDTQAVAELIGIEGLIDQISGVYAFAVDSDEEADAQARLMRQTPEQIIRDRQQNWEPGQCEARDRWGDIAPIYWDYLTTEIARDLDTTPERDRELAGAAA